MTASRDLPPEWHAFADVLLIMDRLHRNPDYFETLTDADWTGWTDTTDGRELVERLFEALRGAP